MQLVIELTASEDRRIAAIKYLKDVSDDLRLHKVTYLAGVRNANLLEYFKAWNNPNDQIIITSLEPIFTISQAKYSSLFQPANNQTQTNSQATPVTAPPPSDSVPPVMSL